MSPAQLAAPVTVLSLPEVEPWRRVLRGVLGGGPEDM